MKKYNLFLDDIRDPSACLNYRTKFMPENSRAYSLEDWVIVRSYSEFTEIIKSKFASSEFPGLISFDHDLADIHYDPEVFQISRRDRSRLRKFCSSILLR